ncbi:MAG TPA: FtsX-like permease family protein [Rhodospirillales bacterium]|jgi:putative ABC transport system permease protein|nr:FtsX-like permease family protein [Rhodospirillales bacterium]HIB21810.1 FtsX-like permease family protein [Rhodospirillales bacterium]HIC59525.1 FtsX-like permease family protein [Rhodospirillales bacterium]HIM20616.1 FtsX-like permease family protein [Rhodospirillales bacterium]HIN75701.1 FtsX-like permease family protein [Rhodospirillales bacterium]|tara:strand:+ start:396 stop:1607 length:1212 start_codon:yes stop_codon:yes gene_type:complete
MAALGAIQANVLRSVLTALGIIIGVAAVIVMISVGAGAQKQVDDVIKKLGSNLVIVVPGTTTSGGARGARGSRRTLTEDDAIAIQNEVPTVKVSAPTVRGSGQIIFGNQNWSTVIRGVTPDYGQAREWEIADGRWFSNDEVRSAAKVALIGETVSESLFGNDNPVGQIIRIKRVPFTVIGTLVGKGETPMGNDMDDVVFIPLTTAKKRTLGGRRVSGRLVGVVFVKSNSAEVVDDTIRDMTKLLRLRHKLRPGQPNDFFVRNLSSILEARANSSRVMNLLLAAVASISLIVGGIGIMNIMLVSVTERTREIGLRMAVGAKGRDILLQFLIEAVTLSLIGGVIGIVFGLGGSYIIAMIGNSPAIVQPYSIFLAFGFAAAVGVFFGFYPARKAARLDPIEALRYE